MQLKRKLVSLTLVPFGMIVLCACSAPVVGAKANPAVINPAPVGTSNPSPVITKPSSTTSSLPVISSQSDLANAESSLNKSLSSLAVSVAYPSAAQIKDATQKASSDHQEIEISPVETPTGLRADSIEVAFAADSKACIFGYIQGKNISTSILPTLSNGKCMIGATS